MRYGATTHMEEGDGEVWERFIYCTLTRGYWLETQRARDERAAMASDGRCAMVTRDNLNVTSVKSHGAEEPSLTDDLMSDRRYSGYTTDRSAFSLSRLN